MNAGLSTKNAPHPNVILPHYAYGAIAFLVASILLFFAADNIILSNVGPKVLSIAHILILGWISMIIFGALYQLIPVIMEVKLYSEKLAYSSFVLLGIGTIVLTISFWKSYIGHNPLFDAGGSMILLAIILFVINTIKSAAKTEQKTVENKFIVSSIVWLLSTVLMGIFIILNVKFQFVSKTNIDLLKIHALWGVLGWFVMLVIGVASKLLPMFFIAHKLKIKYLNISYYLLNSGIITLSLSFYFNLDKMVNLASATLIFVGMFFFIRYNYDAYKARLRRKLDIGLKLSVLAFMFLALTLITGVISLTQPAFLSAFVMKINVVYGISLILGFFTALILGQMYKTLPFIVWLQKYQDKVGKFKTPMPANLYSEKVANLHYFTFIVAILTLIVGVLAENSILVKMSSIVFTITALLYNYNTFIIIFHKEKLKPIVRRKRKVKSEK